MNLFFKCYFVAYKCTGVELSRHIQVAHYFIQFPTFRGGYYIDVTKRHQKWKKGIATKHFVGVIVANQGAIHQKNSSVNFF